MAVFPNKSDDEQQPPAQEGLFDAQLLFQAPYVEAPSPVQHIVKRDGRIECFQKQKIAEAIFRAAESIGGNDRDRACSLASAVAIYLAKTLKGQPPTADQVDDAVEKVLIEMGHARTALAYARYRDRRARIRSLREGDARPLLNELAEARKTGDFAAAPAGACVFVRTSGEKFTQWNREKIVAALVKETGLDPEMATLVALEVEQQILSADVEVLTSSLVRELVNAKLLEHGLEDHWRRHMRLGVPLYDAERIICGMTSDGFARDPEATGDILAEAIKREFALSQVFSPEAAEAHIRGDIHIHDLGRVDRFHSASHSVESLSRFGVGLPDSRTFSKPPKYADTLLAQMVNSGAAYQTSFASHIGWHCSNVFFAPFTEDYDERGMRQLAQMLVYEYAYRAVVHGPREPITELGIHWTVPEELRRGEAVGPGGHVNERTYGEYFHTVQKLGWGLLEIFKEGCMRGTPFPAPLPLVHISPDFFSSQGHLNFLENVAEVVSLGGHVHFVIDRGDEPEARYRSWEPRDVVAQRVTINLPRLAFQSGNVQELFRALEIAVETAAEAHSQKSNFLERLLGLEKIGPLALLTVRRDGRCYLDSEKALYVIAVTGMNECVQALTGHELHESDEAVNAARHIAARLVDLCAHWRQRLDLRIVPGHCNDIGVARRFAALDLDADAARARKLIKFDTQSQEMFYTPGMRLFAPGEVSPMERVRLEGRLHDIIPRDAVSVISLQDAETSQRAVADFVKKACHNTRCRRIAITGKIPQ
jgi:ribonucleoside-triphosphate reductase